MIKTFRLLPWLLPTYAAFAQGVSGSLATPAVSTATSVPATVQRLLPPRLTQAQRDAIPSPTTGLVVYQTDNTPGFYTYSGAAWVALGPSTLDNHTASQKQNKKASSPRSGIAESLRVNQNSSTTSLLLGPSAGASLTTGSYNQFIGIQSGAKTTTGSNNQFAGFQSGYGNKSGCYNQFNGYLSGYQNTTGSYNDFSGLYSGCNNTTGSYNQFSGNSSGAQDTTGSQNSFFGYQSGLFNTSGNLNVFVGYNSGLFNKEGSNNTVVGANSSPAGSNLTNATALGANVRLVQSNSVILGNGANVGIGTSTPLVPLDIGGGQGFTSSGTYGYYSASAYGTGYTATLNNVSVRASGRIVAQEFNASSDARLKRVLGFSDGTRDLALLRQVRITDYQLRDSLRYGPRHFKKVIAQQVEQVFPQAVTQLPGFLPDVYARAQAGGPLGDSLRLLMLPAGLASAGRASQRLRLLAPRGEVVVALARPAAAGSRTLLVRGAAGLEAGEVFVFGFEHPDVRAVDYEALAMLGVSATQELARRLEALEAQYAALRQQQRAASAAQQADHASLEKLQHQLVDLQVAGAAHAQR